MLRESVAYATGENKELRSSVAIAAQKLESSWLNILVADLDLSREDTAKRRLARETLAAQIAQRQKEDLDVVR